MGIKFFIFFGVILLLYFLANFYVIARASQALTNYPSLRIAINAIIILAAISFFISMVFDSKLSYSLMGIIYPFATVWMAALLYFLMILIAVDLLRLAHHFVHFLPDFLFVNYARTKLISFLISVGLVSILCIVGYYKFSHPVITNLSLTIPKKAGDLKHLRIAMVSDIHLGHIIKNKRLQCYIKQINELNTDIVLISGDIIDRDLNVVMDLKMGEEFKQLKAPMGVFSCLGNHEYIGQEVDKACEYLAESGITVLRDSVVNVSNSFYVIGRDDRTNTQREPLQKLINDIDQSQPMIVLDHQPSHLEEPQEAGIDLQLSGHTHNGQLFPLNLITSYIYEIAHGYLAKGNTHIYVSSGLGLWGPPFRIGTKSEVVCIDVDFTIE